MRRVIIAVLGVVVLIVLFFTLCTYTQRPYETKIVVRFGRIVDNPTRLAYNLFLCLPTDHVVPMDTRLHLFQGQLSEINTAAKEPIMVQIFAAWRIKDPKTFYRTLAGSDIKAAAFIDQKVTGDVAGVIGQHSLSELYNVDETQIKMQAIEQEVIQHANVQATVVDNGQMRGLLEEGLEVTQVGFSRFAFPPEVATSVYQRMVAERNVKSTDFRTQGDSEKTRLISEGEQEAKKISTAAEAEAQKIRGEGEAQAIAILSSVQQDVATRDFYQYWKKTDILGKSLTTNTYIIMTPDDPLLAPVYKFANGNSAEPATRPAESPATQPASHGLNAPLNLPLNIPLNTSGTGQ